MSRYFIDTPFDSWLIFEINRGVDFISFSDIKLGSPLTGELFRQATEALEKADVSLFDHSSLNLNSKAKSYKLYMFLRKTKAGETCTYSEAAEIVYGSRNYARAVASMLAANRFAYFIPCHRVVAANGIGGFSANVNNSIALKKRILKWESMMARKQ